MFSCEITLIAEISHIACSSLSRNFFLKNKINLRTLKSRNLMAFFSYLPVEIEKIKPLEKLSCQIRRIKYFFFFFFFCLLSS